LARGTSCEPRSAGRTRLIVLSQTDGGATIVARDVAVVTALTSFTQTVSAGAERFALAWCCIANRIATATATTGVTCEAWHTCIARATILDTTGCVASVECGGIAVITCFTGFAHTVAARARGLAATGGRIA
jgi:hypothetical protein